MCKQTKHIKVYRIWSSFKLHKLVLNPEISIENIFLNAKQRNASRSSPTYIKKRGTTITSSNIKDASGCL